MAEGSGLENRQVGQPAPGFESQHFRFAALSRNWYLSALLRRRPSGRTGSSPVRSAKKPTGWNLWVKSFILIDYSHSLEIHPNSS